MSPKTDKAEPLTAEELAEWLKAAEYCASFREPQGTWFDEVLRLLATITQAQAQAARDDLLHNIRVLRARAEKAEANARTPGTVEVCEKCGRNAGYYGPTCRTGDCPPPRSKGRNMTRAPTEMEALNPPSEPEIKVTLEMGIAGQALALEARNRGACGDGDLWVLVKDIYRAMRKLEPNQ